MLQSRATDFGSCDPFTCLKTSLLGHSLGLQYGLRILRSVHLSGGYSLGGYSFESCDPFTCLEATLWGGHNLGSYNLGRRISDLATRPLVWRLQSGGPQSRGLQSRATDFGSCDTFISLTAPVCGTTVCAITGYGIRILLAVHLSGGYNQRGYSPRRYNLGLRISNLATRSRAWRRQSGGLQSRGIQSRATEIGILRPGHLSEKRPRGPFNVNVVSGKTYECFKCADYLIKKW